MSKRIFRRIWTCTICHRPGTRRKFFIHDGRAACRDEELCQMGYKFRQALAAMPTADEEREMVREMMQRRRAEILSSLKLGR